MAIDYSNYAGATRNTEIFNEALHAILVDTVDLGSLIVNLGDAAGMGSSVTEITRVDFDDAAATPAEGAAPSATDPTIDSVQVTIARRAYRQTITDLMVGTGTSSMAYGGSPRAALHFAQAAANSFVLKRTGDIATLFSSVSNTVGTTTVDLSVTDIYSAMFQLQNTFNDPPFYCVLSHQQFADFQSSLRGETGAAAFQRETDQMLFAKGVGFRGAWHGINFFASDQVPDANMAADSNGCMFSAQAFGIKEMSVAGLVGTHLGSLPSIALPSERVAWTEVERNPTTGTTDYVANYYYGVLEVEDARAVGIVTDK